MQHIICIKTIITKFIHHDFIGRKIVTIRPSAAQFIRREKQSGLTYLIPMHTVFDMPYGADSEKYLQGRIYFSQFHQHTLPFSDNFLHRKKLPGKKAVGLFMTISYHHRPFFQPISKGSPPSNDQPIKPGKSGRSL